MLFAACAAGGTRWTLLPGSLEHLLSEPCEACGGPVVLERRRPGARPRVPGRERRHGERPAKAPLSPERR